MGIFTGMMSKLYINLGPNDNFIILTFPAQTMVGVLNFQVRVEYFIMIIPRHLLFLLLL